LTILLLRVENLARLTSTSLSSVSAPWALYNRTSGGLIPFKEVKSRINVATVNSLELIKIFIFVEMSRYMFMISYGVDH